MGIKGGSACWLGGLLCAAILTMWVPGAWITPSLFQAGLFLLACVWALRMIWRPYRVAGSWVLWCLGFAVLWPLAQLAANQTVSRWETWNAALLWAGNFTAAFLALQVFSGEGGASRRARFLRMLGFFAFGIVLVSLFDSLTGQKRVFWFEVTGSQFGPFLSRDRMAAFGELTLPVILYGAFRRRVGLLEVGMAAAVFAAVIAGASRAGAVLMTGEALVLVFMGRKREGMPAIPRLQSAMAAFAAMAVIFTATVGAGNLAGRFEEKNPYSARREMLLSAIEMTRERPLFGFGMGNFENAYPKYALFDTDKVVNAAHNDWAEWAATGGLPLFVAMCGVAGWAARPAYRSVWGIGILAVFAHSLVDFPLQNPTMEFWQFTLIGVLAAEAAPTTG